MSRHDPIRLSEASAESSYALSSAIRSMRAECGSVAMAEALQQRLAADLGPAALGGVGAPTGNSSWLSTLCVLGLAAMSFVPPAMPDAPPRIQIEQTVPIAALSAQPYASVLSTAGLPVSAVSEPRIGPTLLPRPLRAKATRPKGPRPRSGLAFRSQTAQPARVQPEAELELLRRSQALLRRNPSAALALAEQHATDYPQGVFAQEREILAVEALLKQHRRASALLRAQQFVERYRGSPYAFRVQLLLEQAPRQVVAPMLAQSAAADEVTQP